MSLFAWTAQAPRGPKTEIQKYRGLFAEHPSEFKNGNKIPRQANSPLKDIDGLTITHKGIRFDNLPLNSSEHQGTLLNLLEFYDDGNATFMYITLTKVLGGYVRSNPDLLFVDNFQDLPLGSHERRVREVTTFDPAKIFIRKVVLPSEATAVAKQYDKAIFIEVDTSTDILDAQPAALVWNS